MLVRLDQTGALADVVRHRESSHSHWVDRLSSGWVTRIQVFANEMPLQLYMAKSFVWIEHRYLRKGRVKISKKKSELTPMAKYIVKAMVPK